MYRKEEWGTAARFIAVAGRFKPDYGDKTKIVEGDPPIQRRLLPCLTELALGHTLVHHVLFWFSRFVATLDGDHGTYDGQRPPFIRADSSFPLADHAFPSLHSIELGGQMTTEKLGQGPTKPCPGPLM